MQSMEKSAYKLPHRFKPSMRNWDEPCHASILKILLDAKNKGDVLADSALAELSNLTETHYEFSREFGTENFEIEGRK